MSVVSMRAAGPPRALLGDLGRGQRTRAYPLPPAVLARRVDVYGCELPVVRVDRALDPEVLDRLNELRGAWLTGVCVGHRERPPAHVGLRVVLWIEGVAGWLAHVLPADDGDRA